MSERERRDWLRFATTRPLPDELLDVHFARLCALVVNFTRAADSAPVAPAEFLLLRARPNYEGEPRQPGESEAERMKAALTKG